VKHAQDDFEMYVKELTWDDFGDVLKDEHLLVGNHEDQQTRWTTFIQGKTRLYQVCRCHAYPIHIYI
jgi:hypothetical protein